MPTDLYDPNCDGCKLSQGLKEPRGKVLIAMEGGWTLNHYGGSEGFLGWLALQPRYHRMEIADLTRSEAAALGPNIQRIDAALRQYWSISFSDDLIKRLYVLHFHEGPFDEKPSPYHLHLHLIPRTQKLRALLRTGTDIIAYDIYKVSKAPTFPAEYKVDEPRAERLATFLKSALQSAS